MQRSLPSCCYIRKLPNALTAITGSRIRTHLIVTSKALTNLPYKSIMLACINNRNETKWQSVFEKHKSFMFLEHGFPVCFVEMLQNAQKSWARNNVPHLVLATLIGRCATIQKQKSTEKQVGLVLLYHVRLLPSPIFANNILAGTKAAAGGRMDCIVVVNFSDAYEHSQQ